LNLRRAVFLDRDGVLNEAIVRDGKPYPPARLPEFRPAPGMRECLERLRAAGYLLIVVTNQPDVARGTQSIETVEKMNEALRLVHPLDAVYMCLHDSADTCDCRKPKPGMLLRAASDWNIDLAGSFMMGDRWRDVEAGARAGCRTVFLDFGYNEKKPDHAPSVTVGSLREGVDWILNSQDTR